MKTTNTIKNFAMRFVTVIAVVLLAGNAWGTDATYTFNSSAGLSAIGITAPSTGNGTDLNPSTNYTVTPVTMTVTHGGTNTRVWNSSGTLTLRLYKNGTLTFSVSSDYKLTSIALGTASNLSASTGSISGTTWSPDNNTSPTSVTFTRADVNGTTNFSSITVSYESACSTKLTVTKAGQTNGTFSLRAGTANGDELTGTGKNQISNCSSQTVYVVPSPATGYVASACTATNKTSGPTASGSNWYIVYPSSNSNTSSTVTVTFSGKQCALVFNQNNGTGGQTSNLTATYGSAMPSISGIPTRDHYNFLGYYDGTGNTATQYYTSTGASARNWDKNTTSNTTLYARWEEKNIARYVTNCCTPLGSINGSINMTTLRRFFVIYLHHVKGHSIQFFSTE